LIDVNSNGSCSPLFRRPSKKYYSYDDAAVGKNHFDTLSKQIAKDLGKDDFESYTTHSYRRTGATMLATMGASNEELRLMGDWISPQVASHYVQDADVNKERILHKTLNLTPTKKRKQTAEELQYESFLWVDQFQPYLVLDR